MTRLELLGSATVFALASLTAACTPADQKTGASDSAYDHSGFEYSPASANCIPDINHCASYPTGDVTKDGPPGKQPSTGKQR
jgi:hypothetical protein